MRTRKVKPEQTHRFSYQGLDRVIHERARLSILASLLAHPKGLLFGELLEFCNLTDGNLSRHLQVLQSARLVTVSRDVGPGRPQTTCRFTSSGRRRFLEYLAVLEQVLLDATNSRDPDSHPDAPSISVRG